MRGAWLSGLLLLGAGGLQLLALGYPLVSGQPALGTSDSALVLQVPLGIVLLGAGVFNARRGVPFDQGVAVGLGALLLGRAAVLALTAVDQDLDLGPAYLMIIGGCLCAAAAAAIAWQAAPASGHRRLPVATAMAMFLGAAAFAFDAHEGVELLFDGVWPDLGVAAEVAAAMLVPALASSRTAFGAGMVGGEAAVLATLAAGVFAVDLGIGFGTWCAMGASLLLIYVGVALTPDADEPEVASGPGTLAS